jgi:chromosome segregation ATPase
MITKEYKEKNKKLAEELERLLGEKRKIENDINLLKTENRSLFVSKGQLIGEIEGLKRELERVEKQLKLASNKTVQVLNEGSRTIDNLTARTSSARSDINSAQRRKVDLLVEIENIKPKLEQFKKDEERHNLLMIDHERAKKELNTIKTNRDSILDDISKREKKLSQDVDKFNKDKQAFEAKKDRVVFQGKRINRYFKDKGSAEPININDII